MLIGKGRRKHTSNAEAIAWALCHVQDQMECESDANFAKLALHFTVAAVGVICASKSGKMKCRKKINKVKEVLKLPSDHEIPTINSLSMYNPATKERTQIKVLNLYYHIAHSPQFTNYFSRLKSYCDKNNNDNNLSI